MPISHLHRAIFVHIPKTAGTAIEVVLGMHGVRTDIGLVPYYQQELDFEHLYGRQMQHMTASEIRGIVNDDALFTQYFKFTVVRNPWDRLVSALAWTDQKWARGIELQRDQFETQLRQIYRAWKAASGQPPGLPQYLYPQHGFIHDETGQPLVDYVAKYESLVADWERVCERLGVSAPLPIRMKSHHRPYQSYYCSETKDLVAEIYRQDIAIFNYGF